MKIKRYNKLIRDKIPEICLKNGAVPKIRIARNNDEFISYLQKKIKEESLEVFKEKNFDKLKDEIADLAEVLDELRKAVKMSKKELGEIRERKNKKRGAFQKRIILLETKE